MGVLSWLSSLVDTSAETGPVQEAGLPGMEYDDLDANLPGSQAAGNWRRLTQGASDLSPLTQKRMQELALYLSDKNPLARGILDLLTSFIVGEGFTVTTKDKNVQTIIDRFWEDGQNDMDSRVEDLTRELAIYGEQLLLAFVNQQSGRVALVSVDPRTIVAVVPHPLATDRPFAVGLAGEAATTETRYIKIITEDDDPRSETYGKLIGAGEGETFKRGDETLSFYQPPADETGDGQTRLAGCFFWPINKPRAAMRGRSDLLAVADFVDLYDRLLFDESERMSFLRTFVWDVKVMGATASDLAARAAAETAPRPGGVKFHNESEEWNPLSPNLNSDDSQKTADLILSLVATGVGLPKTYLNGIMDVNRASATEMSEPAIKRLTTRQKYVRRAIERVVRFTLDQAEIAGTLKPADDGRHPFTVSTPEMSARDLERAARSLLTATQAMGMAVAAGWVDAQTAQSVMGLLLGQLGLDVDLDEIRKRLEDAVKAASDAEDERIPDYFGQGALPGSDTLTRAMGGAGKNGASHGGNGTNGTAAAAGAVPIVTPMAKDMAGVIDTVSKSLVALGNARVIDGEVAQDIVAKLFAGLGIEIDVEAMRERLEAEMAVANPEPDTLAAPAAGGAGGAALPDVEDLINLDVQALEAVREIGMESLIDVGMTYGEDALTNGFGLLLEAFEASLHPRGPGGKFATKPGDEQGAGAAAPAGDEASGQNAEIEKQVKALVAKLTQQAATAEKKPRKPRKPPDHPAMNQAEMKATIGDLKAGDDITIGLTNGLEVSGKVTISQSGGAVIQTADGKYTILHAGLKGVASVSTPDWTNAAGPREPRKPRAPAGTTASKPPADRSASAQKAAATRAANRAAATTTT